MGRKFKKLSRKQLTEQLQENVEHYTLWKAQKDALNVVLKIKGVANMEPPTKEEEEKVNKGTLETLLKLSDLELAHLLIGHMKGLEIIKRKRDFLGRELKRRNALVEPSFITGVAKQMEHYIKNDTDLFCLKGNQVKNSSVLKEST